MKLKDDIIHARVDKELKAKLQELAEHNKRSLTNMLEILIEEAYKQFNLKEWQIKKDLE